MGKRHFFILLAACILFVFVFNPTHLYFLSDDWDSLLFSLQPSHILHSFRPLADASLLLDYYIWKMDGSGYHLTNYILHFSSVFCLYHFAKQILLLWYDGEITLHLSLAVSLFYLYYPFHSEAVFWIVGRGAIFCTLFGLLSLLFFIQKDENRFYYPLSILCFSLALLSYEEAWIIPVFITILVFLYNDKGKANRTLQAGVFWVVFLFYLAGRFYFTQNVIGTPYGSERMMNFDLLFLIKNFAAFVFRSVIPPFQSSAVFVILCAGTGLISVAILFFYRKKIHFGLALCIALFLLSLIPVLPLGINTHNTESERYLYFPSVFFILSIVQLLALISIKKNRAVYAMLFVGIIPLWMSYDSFKTSSTVSRKTAEIIHDLPDTDTLFCQKLPGQYKGAFIFRNGFKSMIKLEKANKVKNIVILSRSDLLFPARFYSAEFDKLSEPHSSDNALIYWTEQKVILKKYFPTNLIFIH